MAFQVDGNGNITLIQGDSGNLVLTNLNTDKNYTVYFGIKDAKRNPVGNELHVKTHQLPSVIFELTADYTDLLDVPKNKSYEVYYYGIKLCSDDNTENTLSIGNNEISSINTITVYPKKVEGGV